MRFYVDHARRFGLAATARYAGWRLRDRLSGYVPYCAFTRGAADPIKAPAPGVDGIACRELGYAELAEIAADTRYEIGANFLETARRCGHLCIGAFAERDLVGYAFSAAQPSEIDADFRFEFPAGWVYNFKAFTLPHWRGRKVHARLWAARQAIFGERGYTSLIGLAISTNYASVRSFERLGFQPAFEFAMLGRPGRRRLQAAGHGTGDGDCLTFAVPGVQGTFAVSRLTAQT